MSLSSKNLAAIQKAGHAVYSAADAIAQTLNTQAQSTVASAASNLLGAAFDQDLARLKAMARLSHGLNAAEVQLRELYALAQELADPASDVMIALPSVSKRKLSNTTAVDVLEKPAKAAKASKKTTPKAPPKAKAIKPSKRTKTTGSLTANDSKLLSYLLTVLTADTWTTLTGAVMASGSGLPYGSVGASLKKILAAGAVKAGDRGQYQLGAPVSATETVAADGPAEQTPAPKKKSK